MRNSSRSIGILASLLALVAPAGVRAEMVAGWDFSQYFGDGELSIDGVDYTNVLDANYSNLDPTFNAGVESAEFGRLYLNGEFGSTSVPAGSGTEPILPSAATPGGSLVSNLEAPVQSFGDNPFDSFTVLQAEGQVFASLLSLLAVAPSSAVFKADRKAPASGEWVLSFGGRTQVSGESTLGIEFSPDGSSYSSVGSVVLTSIDTPYEVELGPASGATAFVRINFNPGADPLAYPHIDNVAISVPEPLAAGQLLAAGLSLSLLARLRRR